MYAHYFSIIPSLSLLKVFIKQDNQYRSNHIYLFDALPTKILGGSDLILSFFITLLQPTICGANIITILHGQLIYSVFLADVWFGTYICDGEDERESEGLSFVLYFIVVVVQLKAINEIGQDLFNICLPNFQISSIISY